MTVWTIANQKGGVGKTTTAVALASLLAARGRTTLLVDLDPHASATAYLLAERAVRGGAPAMFDRVAAGTAGDTTFPHDLVDATGQEGLLMLSATPALATLERRFAATAGMGSALSRALGALEMPIEHVVVDCPPTLGLLMINALAAADRVLIPVQTEHLALEGLKRMMGTLAMIERSQRRALDRLVIPTLYDCRTRASRDALQRLRNEHAAALWPDVVPVDTRLRDAARAGQPAPVYCPGSRAVTAYERLLSALLGARCGASAVAEVSIEAEPREPSRIAS